jgi:mannose-6-phosphate isomerase-like protein (cupin superfamily)
MTRTKSNNKEKYKNLVVTKPWGSEYIVCENKTTATWLLNIKKNHKTSLHCHPLKKTGFILLDGTVQVELGFYEKVILKAPSKLMIRPGLFHSTKALSKNNATVLEIETPIDKNDLVRFKDNYGRENKPYEKKDKMKKKLLNDINFQVPKKFGVNKYKFKNLKITVEKHKNAKKLANRPQNTIFAILDGGLADKKKRYVLSPGDIVRTDTITKLAGTFNVLNKITVLTISKK